MSAQSLTTAGKTTAAPTGLAPGFTVDRLSHAYRRPDPTQRRQAALDSLTCTIPAGSRTVLLGLNGSGKSTLLHLLSWLDRMPRPEPGRIIYVPEWRPEGIDYARTPWSIEHALRSSEFGFVGQQPFMLPHLTCADNITMPLALAGVSKRKRAERLEEVLALIQPRSYGPHAPQADDLRVVVKRLAHRVSGGERQLMAVLRAVVSEPAVLFADEPFNHLDLRRSEKMVRLFLQWQEGTLAEDIIPVTPRTLVLVCHDLDIAAQIATHAIILDSGTAIESRSFSMDEFGKTTEQRRIALDRLLEAKT